MNRDVIIGLIFAQEKRLTACCRRYIRVHPELVEDASQEAWSFALEHAKDVGEEGDVAETVFALMRRGASRAIAKHFANAKRNYSLDAPVSEEDTDLSWIDRVTYGRGAQINPEIRADARKATKAMEALDGREIGILLAFVDGVDLQEIAKENALTELDVLAIRNRSIEKVQTGMFSALGEKLLLASIADPRKPVAQLAIERAA